MKRLLLHDKFEYEKRRRSTGMASFRTAVIKRYKSEIVIFYVNLLDIIHIRVQAAFLHTRHADNIAIDFGVETQNRARESICRCERQRLYENVQPFRVFRLSSRI